VSQEPLQRSNTEKDPDDWVTGGEQMTGAQASYLQTLSQEAGEEFDASLSKAEASSASTSSRRRRVGGGNGPMHWPLIRSRALARGSLALVQ
jgi:hypothetical protein